MTASLPLWLTYKGNLRMHLAMSSLLAVSGALVLLVIVHANGCRLGRAVAIGPPLQPRVAVMGDDAAQPNGDDAAVQAAIERARLATLGWLDTLQAPGEPAGVLRTGHAHDAARWPGMLLPGTYDGVLCRHLLGSPPRAARVLAAWLLQHRAADGVFRVAGPRDATRPGQADPDKTAQATDFHVTNRTLAALAVIDPDQPPVLEFARPWLDTPVLKAWLADRDLRAFHKEGRTIANLGSFLLLMRHYHDAPIGPALHVLFTWHERLQEPSTGFWGVGQHGDDRALQHAVAGSVSVFQLWHAVRRPLPYQTRAVDHALTRPVATQSACHDADLVDLLTHAHALIDHRRSETETWLRGKLTALLAFQSTDGGFCDRVDRVSRQDSWPRDYDEPQGLPNTFATFARWTAIALIAETLWPGWRAWGFTSTSAAAGLTATG